MKILDARAGTVSDAETLTPIKKVLGHHPGWQDVQKLRDQPEAVLLAKRFKKHAGADQAITPLRNPSASNVVLHARIHDADESTRTFHATLDQSNLPNYKQSKRAFKDLPAHFHGPGDKIRRGKPAGDLDYHGDDARQKITLTAKAHDEDEWQKVKEGVYGHLRIEHDSSGTPTHVALTDSPHAEAAKYLKLQKRDGSTATVRIKAQGGDVGVGRLVKAEGLDPFRQIFRQPPRRGR